MTDIPGPPGPMGPMGHSGMPGVDGRDGKDGKDAVRPEDEEPKPQILLPPRMPKRVLVAFFDDEVEEDQAPFWAAYLDPLEIDMLHRPKTPNQAAMLLELSLVKRFNQ